MTARKGSGSFALLRITAMEGRKTSTTSAALTHHERGIKTKNGYLLSQV
jgi:hypothetical protein